MRVRAAGVIFTVVIAIPKAFGVDFFGRKNEPGEHWLRWPALHADGDSGIEIGLPGGDAFGFSFLQLTWPSARNLMKTRDMRL